MVRDVLNLLTDKGLGDNNPTFHDIEITEYSYKRPRMGMPELTATLMWPTCLDKEWSGDEYVVLRGERYYLRDTPTSSKKNTDARYEHKLEFLSEREILSYITFLDIVPDKDSDIDVLTANKPTSNSDKFTFYGTIGEFIDRFNCALLKAGVGDSILATTTHPDLYDVIGDGYCLVLGGDDTYDFNESKEFSIDNKMLWEVLSEAYNTWEIPFSFQGKTCIFAPLPNVIDTIFEYVYDNELLSVTKTNAKAKVITRITAKGSSDNIPYYYPNDTEYGNIVVKASEDNSVLTTAMLSNPYPNLLCDKIREGEKVTLRKVGEWATDGKVYTYNYSTLGKVLYSLGKNVKYVPDGYLPSMVFPTPKFITQIILATDSEVALRDIRGNQWSANMSTPDSGLPSLSTKDFNIFLYSASTTNIDGATPLAVAKISANQSMLNFEWSANGSNVIPKGTYQIVISPNLKTAPDYITLDGFDIYVPVKIWCEYDGRSIGSLATIGMAVDGEITADMDGDSFLWTAVSRVPFQTTLMPPKYRNTLGAERFYNALNTPYTEEYALAHSDAYIDPDTQAPYEFDNVFREGFPREHTYENDKIKPTITGIRNAEIDPETGLGKLFGEVVAVAYDSDDSDATKAQGDGELEYEHSYFYIKLNIFNGPFGFDLFNSAAQTGKMTLQFTSGNCNGCKFEVGAIEKTNEQGMNYFLNPVQVTEENGDIVSGSFDQKVDESNIQSFQQNTMTNSVWIALKKEESTFGVIMPNVTNSYKPQAGDTFNIIDIELPKTYLLAAEKRLEEEMMRYMSDNNEEKFTFSIGASRIFFAENPNILAALNENSLIDIRYDGEVYRLYVSQITIDCKDSEALPDIKIEITEELSVGQGFARRIEARMISLIANAYTMQSAVTGGNTIGGGAGINSEKADRRYIRKDKSDTTPHRLASLQGFEVGEFVGGMQGGVFHVDPTTGKTYIETDNLRVRGEGIISTLDILETKSIGGQLIVSPGGSITITFVYEVTNESGDVTSYLCYFKGKSDDSEAKCLFEAGDMAIIQNHNIAEGILASYYWGKVLSVNNDDCYVELSATDCAPNSISPKANDVLCQFGNADNDSRQNAILISTVQAVSPNITLLHGIDSYNINNCRAIDMGVTPFVNIPYFSCYGSFYSGPKDRSTFIEYDTLTGRTTFKGEILIESSISGKALPEYIGDFSKYLREALNNTTTINGGLMLTSHISLGVTNSDGSRVTWAGINGIYDSSEYGNGIASWWGGPPVDKEADPSATDYAKALIRMDGTGYLADGNITWDSDGAGSVAGGSLYWDKRGNVHLGSGIIIGDNSSAPNSTLAQILNFVNGFNTLLVPVDENGNELSLDNVAQAVALKSRKGFFSEQWISAKRRNTTSIGGTGNDNSYNRLDYWDDYTPYKAGYVLSAKLGYDLKGRVTQLESSVSDIEENETTILNSANEYTDAQLTTIIGGAPENLDTLKEIAEILDNDSDTKLGLIQQMAQKADAEEVSKELNKKVDKNIYESFVSNNNQEIENIREGVFQMAEAIATELEDNYVKKSDVWVDENWDTIFHISKAQLANPVIRPLILTGQAQDVSDFFYDNTYAGIVLKLTDGTIYLRKKDYPYFNGDLQVIDLLPTYLNPYAPNTVVFGTLVRETESGIINLTVCTK